MKNLLLALSLLFIVSCNSEEGSKEEASTKALFSVWTEKDVAIASATILDLRDAEYNVMKSLSIIDENNNQVCTCNGKLYGGNLAGFYDLNCGGCPAPYDTINVTGGSYTITGQVMRMCDDPNDSSTCTDYE